MFSGPRTRFCCDLQCFVVIESEFTVICNVVWSWIQILLLFTMFWALGIRFWCYLQCFGVLETDFAVIYNVSWPWNQILLLFIMFWGRGSIFCCDLQCFLWKSLKNIVNTSKNAKVSPPSKRNINKYKKILKKYKNTA